MEKHWAKNISIYLYTINLKETQHFYSVILGFDCDEVFDNYIILSLYPTSFIFTSENLMVHATPNFLNFEVQKIDKLWEAIRLKVDIVKPISDSNDGKLREFIINDNNKNNLRFFEKNKTKQLNIDFYKFNFQE